MSLMTEPRWLARVAREQKKPLSSVDVFESQVTTILL